MSKIVFLINSLTHGGSEKVITLLISALKKEGLTIDLVCLEKNTIQKLDNDIKVTYLSNLNGEEHAIIKILCLPILLIKFLIYLSKNNVQVVQSHIFRANYINLLASRINKTYTVQIVDVISIDYFQNKSFSGTINLFLIKHLYNYADTVIFKAEQMRQNLLKFMPLSCKTQVINNPYDVKLIEDLCNEDIDDFTFNTDKSYIVTVGRLSKQKNQTVIIDAIKNLHVNTELIIVGDGEEHQFLHQYIISKSLSHRVHLLGAKSNPFKYIKHSDIFVLSSNQEGFPNVLVEAMLCKTAVISTDCVSGPREILAPNIKVDAPPIKTMQESEYGILIPLNDSAKLEEAIVLLLKNTSLRDDYRTKAYQRALTFSIDKITQEYKEILCAE